MVLEEPFDISEEKFVPSFERRESGSKGAKTEISDEIVEALIEFETKIVPNMLEAEWMNTPAKARRKPFNNKRDQTMISHILPGVEVLSGIVERCPSVENAKIKNCISLWVIHDIHKIIDSRRENEFNISMNSVEEWSESLGLLEFSGSLDIEDLHSCAVGLHNGDRSKLDDSTNEFTRLRPLVRLTDAIMSIHGYAEYRENSERIVNAVFGRPDEKYIPTTHSVELDNPVMRKLVNKSIYQIMGDSDSNAIDIRTDGVLYVRSEKSVNPVEIDDIGSKITERVIDNMRSGYQVFRNKAYLGGDIDSPQARSEYNVLPRVFEISKLSKLCLNEFELVQRIVQATVEQQDKKWEISDESERQINLLNEKLDVDLNSNPILEGMAALVHTVYREILPVIVDENDVIQHRTLESATLEVFDCSEKTQEMLINAMECDEIKSSAVNWPYKYIIAKDVNERITGKHSKSERQKILVDMLCRNLSKFHEWDEFGNSGEEIYDEIYLRVTANTKINGKRLNEIEREKFAKTLNEHKKSGNCDICGVATSQEKSSPDLLSHRDFDILEKNFVTSGDDGLQKMNLKETVPYNPICVCCQVELTMRAQQIGNHTVDNKLHISIHPVNSLSTASLTRFSNILHYLKTSTFGGKRRIPYTDMSEDYETIMENYLSQKSGVSSLVNRSNVFDIGTGHDEINSAISMPDTEEYTVIGTVICVVLASIVSGVRVCISRSPQLQTDMVENDQLIVFGPELQIFNNLLENKKDVTSLPNQMKILDRLLVMGKRINSPTLTVKRYADMDYRDMLPGSRIHSMLSLDDELEQSVLDAADIDAVASQNSVMSRDVLICCSELAKPLSKVYDKDDFEGLYDLLEDVFRVVQKFEKSDNKERLKETVKDEIARSRELDIGLEDLRKNGCVHQFATEFSDMVEEYSDQQSSINHIRRPVIDGTVVRTIIYNQGDENEQ